MEKKLLSVSEVSKILGINTSKVGKLIRKGFIPCLLLSERKVRPESIQKFLDKYEGYDLRDLDNIKLNPFTNNLSVIGEKINVKVCNESGK